MPTKTPETLDQRAQRVAREAAEVAAEQARLEAEHVRRLAEHQDAFDRHVVTDWRPRELDAAVEQARRDLDAAVRAHPLTAALADYLGAQTRRSEAWREYLAARGRLGMPVAGAQMPGATAVPDLPEAITRAAYAIAEDLLAAEREDRHTRRNTPEEQ